VHDIPHDARFVLGGCNIRCHVKRLKTPVSELQVLCTVTQLFAYCKFGALCLHPSLGVCQICTCLDRNPIYQMPRRHSKVEDPVDLVVAVCGSPAKGALKLSEERFGVADGALRCD
jgi:hypothetical protein